MSKLIKLKNDHYIIVDDSEIKEGDWMIRDGEQPTLVTPNFWWDFGVPYKKITHSTQPLEVKITDEGIHLPDWSKIKALSPRVVKELIGEVDVEKKAREIVINNNPFGSENFSVSTFNGLVKDITKALEDNKDKKYTEEDMKNALFYALNHPKEDGVISITRDSIVRKSIQSLQPKTEWEVEFIDGKLKLK